MTNLDGLLHEHDRLDRPLPEANLVRHERVELMAFSALERYPLLQFSGAWSWVPPPPDLLLRFVNLRHQTLDRVLDFARRWGALDVCMEHGRPWNHADAAGWNRADFSCPDPLHLPDAPKLETIAAWQSAIIRADDLLRAANTLHRAARRRPPMWDDEVHSAHRMVMTEMPRWLSDARVEFQFSWWTWPRRPEVQFYGRGLFGVVAVRLLMAVSASSGFWRCSTCGNWYAPPRAPREGENSYCAQCGGWQDKNAAEVDETASKRAAWREAKRRQRAGLAKKRRRDSDSWPQLTPTGAVLGGTRRFSAAQGGRRQIQDEPRRRSTDDSPGTHKPLVGGSNPPAATTGQTRDPSITGRVLCVSPAARCAREWVAGVTAIRQHCSIEHDA
jgi:hypothetical protein